ncbi:ACT domain-containing protein [Ignicoccus hospitalis]
MSEVETYVIRFSIYAAVDGGLDGLARAIHVVRKAPITFHDMAVIDSGKTKEVSLRISGKKKDVEWLAKKLEKVVEVLEVKVQKIPAEIAVTSVQRS